MRPNWTLGFLSLFSLMAIPQYNIIGNQGLVWILWLVWIVYFIPVPENKIKNKNGKKK